MPLQNRVDPFGQIHAVAARGSFTGNRGVIHDPETRTLMKRRWTTKAWIVCVCEFRGVRRNVMGRNARSGNAGWTELFFLDEVTALAAGHRPCFYCRREAAKFFSQCFAAGRSRSAIPAPEVDAILHGERLASGGRPLALTTDEIIALPDGAVIASNGAAFAVHDGAALPWSFSGYGEPLALDRLGTDLALITPPSTVAALRAGYAPVWSSLTSASTGR